MREFTPTARAVLAYLAVRCEDPGYAAYPSITSMAESLEVSRRSVQRALADLVSAERIRLGDAAAVRKMRADRRPAVYDVLTPELLAAESTRAARMRSAGTPGPDPPYAGFVRRQPKPLVNH